MIHSIYTMTIRRYSQMQDTKNENLLKRWFNPFPLRWFNTTKFFDDFNEIFGNKDHLNSDIYLSRAYNVIMMLDTMYKTSYLLMKSTNQTNLFALIFKRKTKDFKNNLPKYRDKIKKLTRIDIFDKDGLNKLGKEIDRRKEKYLERNKKEKPQEIDFMEFVYGVFSVCEIPYNQDLTLYEFSKLRERADKIIKKRQSKADGGH